MKINKIIIQNIPYQEQDYDTVGNYTYIESSKTALVEISAESKEAYYSYIIHELIEMFLTEHRGISWIEITKFDIDSKLEDPGSSEKAPYHKEHEFANKIEQMFLKEFNQPISPKTKKSSPKKKLE